MAFSIPGITNAASTAGGAAQDLFAAGAYKAQAKGYKLQSEGLRLSAAGYREAAPVYQQQAGLYEEAADVATGNAAFVRASTAIQKFQAERGAYKAIGGATADAAGQGALSGSALDIIRDAAMQASLTSAMIETQGAIDAEGVELQAKNFMMQAENSRLQAAQAERQAQIADLDAERANEAAKSSKKLAMGSTVSGVFKAVSSIGQFAMML